MVRTRRKAGDPLDPRFPRIAREISSQLKKRGIQHALIGGMAVGVYGYPHGTDDVDFLLPGEAGQEIVGDSLGGTATGKTIVFKGVGVDFLLPNADEEFLEEAIERARPDAVFKVPVIPQETLVYLKLSFARLKDTTAVIEMLKRGGLDQRRVVTYLKHHRPDLVEDFEALVLQAQHEAD